MTKQNTALLAWIADQAGHNDQFAQWLTEVDGAARDYSGRTLADLPEWGWRDAYEDDLSPAVAFTDALASWTQFDD